ncbi:GmrSD restriction endonuclease domain-containing protein [Gordonia sp. NPDC003376]
MRIKSLLVGGIAAAAVLAGPAVVGSTPAHAAPAANATSALSDLESLPVKGRAPKTGYDRAQFGQAWSDDVTVTGGHNGCDTRNDILRRDLTAITLKPGTRDCVVASGTLNDPYTGQTIQFVRGSSTSSAVQIDHVVALSDAWQKGAQQWSADKRRDFANDPANLLAVSGPANQQKGAGDAATWLPANKSYRCTYVSQQVSVKKTYGLWVTQAEKDAIRGILSSCGAIVTPQQPVPVVPQQSAPQTTAPRQSTPEQSSPSSVYFKNCSQARAAGAAPLYRGQPGYRSALDRDGDGVACE